MNEWEKGKVEESKERTNAQREGKEMEESEEGRKEGREPLKNN